MTDSNSTGTYIDDNDVEADEEEIQIVLDDIELAEGVDLYEEIVSFSQD